MIFKDGFDLGDASAWSGGTVNPLSLSFTAGSAWSSPYGMAVTISSNAPAYVVDNTPGLEARYNARFYFNPNSLNVGKNEQHIIFYARAANGAATAAIQLRLSGGKYQVRAGLISDNKRWSYTGWYTLTNAWHPLEFDWLASAAPGANNGGLTLWLDGIQMGTVGGVDNDQQKIDSVALGAVDVISSATRGTFYFDEFESHRQSYIGREQLDWAVDQIQAVLVA